MTGLTDLSHELRSYIASKLCHFCDVLRLELAIRDYPKLKLLPGNVYACGNRRHTTDSNHQRLICLKKAMPRISSLSISLRSIPNDLFEAAVHLSSLEFNDMPAQNLPWHAICTHLSSSLLQLEFRNIEGLTTLPDWVNQLHALQELRINFAALDLGGPQLVLPEHFGAQLSNLQRLDFNSCETDGCVARLPETVTCLTALTFLDIPVSGRCEGLGSLTGLQCLRLSQMELPDSFWNLAQLTYLSMYWVSGEVWAPGIGNLTALRTLDVEGLDSLSPVPDAISKLESLQTLYLTNTSCGNLPASISALTALQELYITGCNRMTALPAASQACVSCMHRAAA